ncbi:hypothetical protein CDL12_14762 [Handroanthus impetiginosus]|uniref:Uncharacterized protein n=1 Tax=Handroanthus impetiginosus TaxID=429701 RepID=A0A2G9G966_9LAMI|nr:hypothetical protein CDL12_25676 [Handroanthus impetiginosus]PIN12629.1 hypothetical protein CDL12_14762 [Handroanthus impetiginosus]
MLNEGFESLKGAGNVSVDILEFSRNKDIKIEAKEDPDATENSSSFADTTSGNENTSGLSDAEVDSLFFGDSDLGPPFDGFGSVFPIRKKKLTTHWRNFIHPLMWRCKWTELKIKELESQASKYAREIAVNDHKKHLALDQITGEESGTKSMPFMHQSPVKKLMKRRKRKRVEDTTDIALYMSNHILFSERENKRSDLDGVPTWENLGNSDQHTNAHDEFGLHDDGAFPDDDDNFLEQILRKIELVHGRVHKLKAQLDSMMIKHASKFSSSENLSQLVACDVQTSSVRSRSPTFSACNGDTVSVGGLYTSSQNIMDCDIGDFIMPDGAVSSFGEAFPIPDIIESTVGLLSSVDVTQHHPHVGDSSEKIVDNILIQNETADQAEGSTFKYSNNQWPEKTQEAEHSGEETNNASLALEPNVVAKAGADPEQSALKSCLAPEIHFPKNKRKRGERKAGSGNWSRQRPGEPES